MKTQNKQIPLPSSRADVESRRPRGKQAAVIESHEGKHLLTKQEVRDTFDTAKLPEDQVNELQRHLTLGLALLQRARDHAMLAAVRTTDEGMIIALDACASKLESIEKEWPVKIV